VAVDPAQPFELDRHCLPADLRQRVVDRVRLLERSDDGAEASGRVDAVRDDDEEAIEVAIASGYGMLPRDPMVGARGRGELLEREQLDLGKPGQ
jgi:hypothetical protein